MKPSCLMKISALAPILLTAAPELFAQGTITFYNRVTLSSGAPFPVVAPVFSFDPNCPTSVKYGNPRADWNGTNGPTPVPIGTQVYGGVPLSGTGFTAAIWA